MKKTKTNTSLKDLNTKLDKINEEIQLSSLDNTIMGLTYFFIASFIALISFFNAIDLFEKEEILVSVLYIGFIIIILIMIFQEYVTSIIITQSRFHKKTIFLTIISGAFILFGIMLPLTLLSSKTNISSECIISLTILFAVGVFFLSRYIIYPKIKNYFKKNYPTLLETKTK